MKFSSMVKRGVLIGLLLMLAVSSSNAQREFVDRESRGTAIEIAYSKTNDIDGVVGAIGFTGDRDLDLGIGAGKFEVSSSIDVYSFRVGGDYYVAKSYTEKGRFLMSLGATFMHDWYKYSQSYDNINKSYSGIAVGPSVAFGPRGDEVQLIISGGLRYFDMATLDEKDNWTKSAGLAVAFRRGDAWLGVSSGYSNNDSQDTFTIGLLIVTEKL